MRECEGLVDALLHALQSAVVNKDTDNKVGEIITLRLDYLLKPLCVKFDYGKFHIPIASVFVALSLFITVALNPWAGGGGVPLACIALYHSVF